ncbi:DUF3105 domain-containing protein [Rubrobacter indicoceani]|uniref:DUF3105 domain-containing protein n=1 Tax=Rubrobacter indicoceani TaxID=2051957 RepID=UPI001F089D74|nr:DUF3105 domain-containing protein [Rubrobacter indicoceani]
MPERRFPVGLIVAAGLVIAVMIALAVVIYLDVNQQAASGEPAGTETIDVPGAQHTTANVDYDRTPPVGGEHDPAWQNCGSYTEPVRNENAVHSLEHGAVWISYAPGLPSEQIQTISDLAREQTYILASPVEDLASPIVASAWGKQLQLNDASDPELEQFVRAFSQGPQSPEPGAPCTGGVGTPS